MLIDDIFPGTKADKAVFPDIEAAMAKVATGRASSSTRHGSPSASSCRPTWCVTVSCSWDPPAVAKPAICETLAGALTEVGNKHVVWKMNPKAIAAPQMFGRLGRHGRLDRGVFAVLWQR